MDFFDFMGVDFPKKRLVETILSAKEKDGRIASVAGALSMVALIQNTQTMFTHNEFMLDEFEYKSRMEDKRIPILGNHAIFEATDSREFDMLVEHEGCILNKFPCCVRDIFLHVSSCDEQMALSTTVHMLIMLKQLGINTTLLVQQTYYPDKEYINKLQVLDGFLGEEHLVRKVDQNIWLPYCGLICIDELCPSYIIQFHLGDDNESWNNC